MGLSYLIRNAVLIQIGEKVRNNIKIFIVGLILLLPKLAPAEVKIGYIDSNRIMTEFSDVSAVQVELEKEQRRLETDFNSMLGQLDSLKKDFDKQSLLMSESRRDEAQQQIVSLESNIQNFQLEKFGPNGEIYQKQSQLLAPILKKIDDAIQVVGAERGYDYVFDAVSGAIVYALDSHDLTDEVLEQLQKGTQQND